MKKLLAATAAAALCAGAANAESHTQEVGIGVILGFTGPIESLTPQMAASAEMALTEVNESGNFLDGVKLVPVRADSTCVDSAAATAAGDRLVTTDGIVAIMGADCSGVTGAVLQNVAIPNGMIMISPSATSPGLSTVEDNDLFFRTAPSDAREGQVMTDVLMDRGIKSIALTYTNNDYGKGLADAIKTNFEAAGGEVNPDDFDGQSQWANFKGANERVHKYTYGAFSNCNIIDNRERVFPIRSIRDERYTLIWSPKAEVEVTSNTTLTKALALLDGEDVTGEFDPAASWVVKLETSADPLLEQLVNRLHHRPKWALYDRESDPKELTNLVGNPEYSEVQERLQSALEAWLSKWGDEDPVATETGFVKPSNKAKAKGKGKAKKK